MGYNLKSLTNELVSKNLADDGLVAWGQSSRGQLFGAIGSAVASMHVISKRGNQIVIIPFSSKEIKYKEGVVINREKIESAKLSGGLFNAKLIINTKSGKQYKYTVTQGKDAVKKILAQLGL